MTNLATPLRNGPFGGFFTPDATLYALTPSWNIEDQEVQYVIVSGLDADDLFPAETVVFAATPQGEVDSAFYMHHRSIVEFYGENNITRALQRMGYAVGGSDE